MISLNKLLFITLFPLSYAHSIQAETRQEIRETEDRSSFNEKVKANKPKRDTRDYSFESDVPGFRENPINETKTGNITTQVIADAFLQDLSKYKSTLILKITCATDVEFLEVDYRYGDLSWEVLDTDERDTLKGKSQTDGKGFMKVSMSSHGRIGDKKLRIKVIDKVFDSVLGSGPHEQVLPSDYCKSKHGK